MSPLVFVSGPLGAEDSWELNAAFKIGSVLADAGYAVHVPHANVYWHRHFPRSYESWLELDLKVLARCDAVVRLPGESPGADRETARADELGIPVVRMKPSWRYDVLLSELVRALR